MSSSGILTIDLGAIQANWLFVKSRASSAIETGAVIKANAYGLGALQVGTALYEAGCRTFFFATHEEACLLKGSLPKDANLIVLGGVRPGYEDSFIAHQLIPVLYSRESVQRWISYCEQREFAASCVIKVDTGMTRLGLSFDDLLYLSESCFRKPTFNPVLLMSHLACADDPSHPQNQAQLDNFLIAVDFFKQYFPQVRCSLANSSGIFLGSPWHFDLLRPGSALYGINPVPHLPNPLKSVIHLSLPILQVKNLLKDALVGYGSTHKAPGGSRLAVVAGGYADGVNRTLGTKPLAKLDGTYIEAIGKISMDTTIFDLGHLQEDDLTGRFIDVIDNEITLDFLMRRNSSLGYEVLTSLGTRYKRVYRK